MRLNFFSCIFFSFLYLFLFNNSFALSANDTTIQPSSIENATKEIEESIRLNLKEIDQESFSDLKEMLIEMIERIFSEQNKDETTNIELNDEIIADEDSKIENEIYEAPEENNLESIDQNQNEEISTYNWRLYFGVTIFALAAGGLLYLILFIFNSPKTVEKRRKESESISVSEGIFESHDILEIQDEEEDVSQKVIKKYGLSHLSDQHDYKGNIAFTIYSEKIEKKGEDSYPLLAQLSDNSSLICVLDGLGGAGGSILETHDGERNTHAYFASRIVHDFFVNLCNNNEHKLLQNSNKLKEELHHHLSNEIKNFIKSDTGIISKKPTTLPTTVACLIIENQSNNEINSTALWAGDSRCYVLTPTNGLEFHSVDDIKDNDSNNFLIADSPMTNYINAEGKFHINQKKFSMQKPAVFIVATDGCFDYFPSPMHFEYILLKAMSESSNVDQWKQLLKNEILNVTQDDATLSLIGVGWNNFKEMKETFSGKSSSILREFIEPNSEGRSELEKLKHELEEKEKKHKEKLSQRISQYSKSRLKN